MIEMIRVRIKNYKLTLVATLLILIGVLMPGGSVPNPGVPELDKLVHFGMFTVLTVCFYFEDSTYKKKLPRFIAVLIGMSLFALLTEIMQIFADARSFDLRDLAADILGIWIGSLLFKGFRKKHK